MCTYDVSENPGIDFVIDSDGCDIMLENPDILTLSLIMCHILNQVSSKCVLIIIYLMVVAVMVIFHVTLLMKNLSTTVLYVMSTYNQCITECPTIRHRNIRR